LADAPIDLDIVESFDIPQHHTNCEGHFHTGEEAKPTENHKNTLFYDMSNLTKSTEDINV